MAKGLGVGQLVRLNIVHWLVDAARIFGQIVAGEREGARPAATADPGIFATPAFAFAQSRIAQHAEQAGIAIDLSQAVGTNVAGPDGQEAAGVNFAGVRDEDKTAAIAHAGGPIHHVAAVFGIGTRGFAETAGEE